MSVQAQEGDTLRLRPLSEAVVKGVKAQKNAPFSVSNISKNQLETFAVSGKELPFLFARTPGITAWSENGVGTGTSYMRIRGAADSRINVTLDGVSLNSPEDQCVFWANMNSYASLLGGVQIQRGVGTSTNGDGAFGGTIALQSRVPDIKPSLELTGSAASYNTTRVGGRFSTGMLWNHLIFDGAAHHTTTDGYIHGTDGKSGSYYGGLTFLNSSRTLKVSYKNIGNYERTGQAWNGVTTGYGDDSNWLGTYGATTGVRSFRGMYAAGLGRYNTLYEYMTSMTPDANGRYDVQRYTLADGSLWNRTTDNFWQNHNILNVSWKISDNWGFTATAHYTHGHGYYDEFRYNNKLKKFGLTSFVDAEGIEVGRTDFVRQKGLTQDVCGALANATYKNDKWDVVFGAAAQNFSGNHYGYLTYVKHPELRAKLLQNGRYQYYDSDASKWDANAFAKATYHVGECWDLFADVQYRFVQYTTDGVNDKFYKNPDKSYSNQRLDIDKSYHFVNPKLGVAFHEGGHHAYASYARSNREPERNNFTDNGGNPAPKAESLNDIEFGYSYRGACWNVGANGYYMRYHNQFVQTGQNSDIGEPLTTNIKDSYRMGVELTASYSPVKWLTFEANAALSQNKVKDFTECVENWDIWEGNGDDGVTNFVADDGTGYTRIHYSNSTLAFSPSVIVNGFLDFHYKGFRAVWHTNFVGRQYLDNTECKERSLAAYTTSNLHLSYDMVTGAKGLKHAVLGLHLNNLFDRHYAASGWVYSAMAESYGHTNNNRYTQIGYMPMAGFTAMGSLTFIF